MHKERTFLQKLNLFLKGIAMGAANKVPGVSGGTVSFVLGFYEPLIYSFRKVNLKAFKLLFCWLKGIAIQRMSAFKKFERFPDI